MSKEKISIKTRFNNFISKFKKVKHIEVAIAIILGCVALIIFIGSFSKKTSDNNVENNNVNTIISTSSLSEYATSVEDRLKNVLSSIKGVGKVSVFVSVDATPEIVIAEEVEEKIVTSGSTTTTTTNRTPVLVKNGSSTSTIILIEKAPKIVGILVVAEGASDAKVKVDLINAIKALFEIESNKIEIISG